ncbi:MAG TPA: AI-2E family transporter [Anaerolineales bacterium]|nr:AI-2E family transporter [Anaerolineales bacterium]
MSAPSAHYSPSWGPTTKLVVALTAVAIVIGLVVQFRGFIAPLLMALVLAYLLSPLAGFLQRTLHFSWQLSVAMIYLLLFLILIGILTLGGLGLVQQIEGLVSIVRTSLIGLPESIQKLPGQVFYLGPFSIDFSRLDLSHLSDQVLAIIRPVLGSTGTLVGAMAAGAAQFLGWALFVLLISYFVLAESGDVRGALIPVNVPGYADDIRRLDQALRRIWNAFLRGQTLIFLLATVTYFLVLSILGVRYALGIAFLAGLARFIPYVGNMVSWTTLALVAYFQPPHLFGLSPLYYSILCVGIAILVDQVFDNFVTPRIISQALRVHPAAVLIAALVFANLLGLVGVVVAAPILATVTLFWRYLMRKMLDLDPWPAGEFAPPPSRPSRLFIRIRRLLRGARRPRP